MQRRCGPRADAQGGQLGRDAGPLATLAPAGAGSRPAGDRGDPDAQAAQEPELQPPVPPDLAGLTRTIRASTEGEFNAGFPAGG